MVKTHKAASKRPLNKPMRERKGDKKFKVYVKGKGGNVKTVRFGSASMSIKKGNKSAKKSYCARSGGIKGTNDKTSANYWSRRMWDC